MSNNVYASLTPSFTLVMTVVLLLLTAGWLGIMSHTTPLAIRKDPNKHFLFGEGALLTIELARDRADLQNALSHDSAARSPDIIQQVDLNTRLDCAFILLYWITTLSAAAILLHVNSRPLLTLVAVGCILVTLAAACDYAENYNIFQMLHSASTGQLSDAMATAIHRPSLAKWGMLGAGWLLTGTGLLLGGRFLPTKGTAAGAWVFGILLVAIGLICLNRVWSWFHLQGARF